jgi:tubulin monoglycylase TTLL3/8
MWDLPTFCNYLEKTYDGRKTEEKILKQIENIVIYTLESVQDVVHNRKNSHEVFGFDLMVDSNFSVWLIEVNSSPCMEYSTQITKKLVKSVMEDTCKVILDLKINKHSDTGNWKLIHTGAHLTENPVQAGFNLVCEGVGLNPNDITVIK